VKKRRFEFRAIVLSKSAPLNRQPGLFLPPYSSAGRQEMPGLTICFPKNIVQFQLVSSKAVEIFRGTALALYGTGAWCPQQKPQNAVGH
jgi:hypothetical protein